MTEAFSSWNNRPQRNTEFGGIRGGKRKHNRGETPCGQCHGGFHTSCRPRLDNIACSCSCSAATAFRARLAVVQAETPALSAVDCVRAIAPKMYKSFIGGDCFYPVDRSKDNPLENM